MDQLPKEKLAALEALLFIYGEPISFKKIQAILELSSLEETVVLISEFSKRFESAERGLTAILDEEKIQLVTKPAFGKLVEGFVKEELSEDLTPASIETLAIISYFGPISRNRIEYIRGVNSTFILRSLLMRGLVERVPDPENGNTFLYSPSFDMLRHLGIQSAYALPEFEKFRELLKKFEVGESPDSATPPVSASAPASSI